jgi:hypothetical protein
MVAAAKHERPRGRYVHGLTVVWAAVLLAASSALNVIYRGESAGCGWPWAYSYYAPSPVFSLAPRIPPITAFSGGPFSGTDYIALSGNLLVCFAILLASAYAIERWFRQSAIPAFRFGLRGLLVLVTWMAIGLLFFRPSQVWFPEYEIKTRMVEWSLLIEFVGIGLAAAAAVEIIGIGFAAAMRRARRSASATAER